jgi:hypothetical protein
MRPTISYGFHLTRCGDVAHAGGADSERDHGGVQDEIRRERRDQERRDLSVDKIRRYPQRWDEESGSSPRPSRILILWR